MEYTWHKPDSQAETTKHFLQQKGISHRLISKLKKGQGRLLVDGQDRKPHFQLAQPADVTVIFPPEKEDPSVPASFKPLDILYEDENWLVVDKPAGLTSIPGPSNREDTLVNRVKGHLKQKGVQDLVPHVITRLDRFTSGLVLVAKHRFAQGLINKQVEGHQIKKRYYALVEGSLPHQHGKIDFPLGRIKDSFRRGRDPEGKPALTEYWVKEDFSGRASLVDVCLHTGRTHQIRAHFAGIGHPLLGDELYGGKTDLINRQALHAYSLEFTDPFTQKIKKFKSSILIDIKKVLWYLNN